MTFRKFILYVGVVFIIFGVFYAGINIGQNRKGDYEDNKFALEYKNETSQKIQIRYKYILSFETTDSFEAPIEILRDEPLFTLFKDDLAIKNSILKDKDRPIIPEVSNTITLNPGESTEANFVVEINEDIKDVEELIRFETTVIIEELRNKKWTPTYQVVLMKRDAYWSLDKGPIEYIGNISN